MPVSVISKSEINAIAFAQTLSCYVARHYNKSDVFSGMLAEIYMFFGKVIMDDGKAKEAG